MDSKRIHYHADTATLQYHAPLAGTSLLDASLAKELGKIARKGAFEGKPVQRVEVRFDDDVAAQHNADPLGFVGVESVGPAGVRAAPASFGVREDFGMDR